MFSCQKRFDVNTQTQPQHEDVRLPQTPKEKHTVAVLQEVGNILIKVYQNPKPYFEVNAAIYSDYYNDERVLLKDLLFPQISQLYQTPKFKSFNVTVGSFREAFIKTLKEGDYPNLKQELSGTSLLNSNLRTDASVPADTAKEIFTNSSGVAIYFPYSENFGSNFTTNYFNNINNPEWGPLATISSADREADTGPGQKPTRWWDANGDPHITYTPVTISDSYAELYATHIVGVGAEPLRINPANPPPPTNVNRVFVGWTKINNKHQYDKLISFTGNGGGSEIKIRRISGYLQFQNQQVIDFTGDFGDVDFKRRDIRKGNWKRIYFVWDPDWVSANTEQVIAVYEDDTEGTSTFTGSLSTTVTISQGNTIAGSVGFSVQVKTQDELILQRKITRIAYFGAAKADQGCGFQTQDNTFLPAGQYWPIYDCGANWNYTWPYNSY